MGMTQSIHLNYSYPQINEAIDSLATQTLDEVFYTLFCLQSDEEQLAVCTFLVEKAIAKANLMDRHIELIRKFDDKKMRSLLVDVIEQKLTKILEGFQSEHLSDEKVVQRGRDIATFTGKMAVMGILSEPFVKSFLERVEAKDDERSRFFSEEIKKITHEHEESIVKLVREIIADDCKLKAFTLQPKIDETTGLDIFHDEIKKIINSYAPNIQDVHAFLHLGHVLATLYNADLIERYHMDPWFDLARKDDRTIAAFIIQLHKIALSSGNNIEWPRLHGIFHVPVEAQYAMSELLKIRDRPKRDIEKPFYLPDLIDHHNAFRAMKAKDKDAKCPAFTCQSTDECKDGAICSVQFLLLHISHKSLNYSVIEGMMKATTVMLKISAKKHLKLINELIKEGVCLGEDIGECDVKFNNTSLMFAFLYKFDILENDVMYIWMRKLCDIVKKKEKTDWREFEKVLVEVFDKIVCDSMKIKNERLHAIITDTISPVNNKISSILLNGDKLKTIEGFDFINKAIKEPNNLVDFKAASEHLMDLVLNFDNNPDAITTIFEEILTVTDKVLFLEAFRRAIFDKYEMIMKRKVLGNSQHNLEATLLSNFFKTACKNRTLDHMDIAKIYKIICDGVKNDPKFGYEYLAVHFNASFNYLNEVDVLSDEIVEILEAVRTTIEDGLEEFPYGQTTYIMEIASGVAFKMISVNAHKKSWNRYDEENDKLNVGK